MKIKGVRTICATCTVAALSIIAAASPVLQSFVHSLRRAAHNALI